MQLAAQGADDARKCWSWVARRNKQLVSSGKCEIGVRSRLFRIVAGRHFRLEGKDPHAISSAKFQDIALIRSEFEPQWLIRGNAPKPDTGTGMRGTAGHRQRNRESFFAKQGCSESRTTRGRMHDLARHRESTGSPHVESGTVPCAGRVAQLQERQSIKSPLEPRIRNLARSSETQTIFVGTSPRSS
jgi:hypothetical protein